MSVYYEGWVKTALLGVYYYYPVSTPHIDQYTISIHNDIITVYSNPDSTNGIMKGYLSDLFEDPSSPTQDELTLVELEYGVDLTPIIEYKTKVL